MLLCWGREPVRTAGSAYAHLITRELDPVGTQRIGIRVPCEELRHRDVGIAHDKALA